MCENHADGAYGVHVHTECGNHTKHISVIVYSCVHVYDHDGMLCDVICHDKVCMCPSACAHANPPPTTMPRANRSECARAIQVRVRIYVYVRVTSECMCIYAVDWWRCHMRVGMRTRLPVGGASRVRATVARTAFICDMLHARCVCARIALCAACAPMACALILSMIRLCRGGPML